MAGGPDAEAGRPDGPGDRRQTFAPSSTVESATDSEARALDIYDALNRRVEKVVEAPHPTWDRVTPFYYDGWRAIEVRAVELEGTPEVQVEYVRARYGFGVGLDEVVWMDRDRTSSPDGILESRYFFGPRCCRERFR